LENICKPLPDVLFGCEQNLIVLAGHILIFLVVVGIVDVIHIHDGRHAVLPAVRNPNPEAYIASPILSGDVGIFGKQELVWRNADIELLTILEGFFGINPVACPSVLDEYSVMEYSHLAASAIRVRTAPEFNNPLGLCKVLDDA